MGPHVDVLHLSTSDRGGAAIAAARTCSAQRHVGIGARIGYRRSFEARAEAGECDVVLSPWESSTSKATTLINRAITRQPSVLFAPMSTSPALKRLGLVHQVDVVHFHNTYNLMAWKALPRTPGSATVFATLHDERALTAGCHYALGCKGLFGECRSCPQTWMPTGPILARRFIRQREALSDSRIHLVAPSSWIRDRALACGFDESRVHHIPNPIDTGLFNPTIKQEDEVARFRDEGSWTVSWLPGKVEAEVWTALREFQGWLDDESCGLRLRVATTDEVLVPSEIPAIRVPAPSSDRERASFWALGDVGLSVTRADNFPNVALECLAVGTPMCISRVGGACEAVDSIGMGYAIEDPDVDSIVSTLQQSFLARKIEKRDTAAALKRLEDTYGYATIGSTYADIYQRAIESQRST